MLERYPKFQFKLERKKNEIKKIQKLMKKIER